MVRRAQSKKKEKNSTAVAELWTEFCEGSSVEIRDQLIAHYQPFVRSVVYRLRRRLPSSVDVADLQGAADIGLIQAIQSFKPELGVPFEAFCGIRVRGSIMDELRRGDWVPRPVRNRLNQKRVVRESLRHRLGREPGDVEMAEELGLTLSEYTGLYGAESEPPVLAGSKSSAVGDEADSGLDFLADSRCESPLEDAHRRELVSAIASLLDDPDREIVFKRYFQGLTLKEIGDQLDISQSRVSKILGRLIERLKERLDSKVE